MSATDALREVSARDRAVMFHPFLPNAIEDRVVLVSGEGSRVRDAGGRDYLDMHGGAWLSQVGHGRSELGEIAAAQMGRLEHFSTMWNYSNEPAIALAERLVELAPASIAKVQYTSTGSESTEMALKMVRFFHHQRGQADRTVVLSIRGAYHGDGGGGMALGGGPHAGFGPDSGGVVQLTPPWTYHPELHDGQDATDFCVAELERTIAALGADRIAGMFGEPAMAVAGMIPLPADYWPRVSAVLKQHGILLVQDEVVTAFGRSGHWFAANHYGVEPDIILTAKGIASGYVPLGAVLIADHVAEAIGEAGFPAGSSYGGHPVACAVGLGSIEIVAREHLCDNATTVGGYLLERLRAELGGLEVVGDVRGLGLMIGLELVGDRDARTPLPASTPDLGAVLREQTGVIFGWSRGAIQLTPPLILTRAEADESVAALADVLGRLRPDGTLAAAG